MNEPGQRWQIIIDRDPRKVMRRLPRNLLQRIDQAIQNLADDPRLSGCKEMVGYDNYYRIQVGDWRILYAIEDDRLIVLVLDVVPRSGAYQP